MGNTWNIHERMRLVMDEKRITAAELCRRTGISKGSVSQYLSGYVAPRADKLYLIAKALGVTEAFLLGFDIEPRGEWDTRQDKDEAYIIEAYRNSDETTKEMVRRILKYQELTGKVVEDGET